MNVLTNEASEPIRIRSTKPKERPILFSGPMVRAILEGRKTQTRRVIKPQPVMPEGATKPYLSAGKLSTIVPKSAGLWYWVTDQKGRPIECPYGVPGERLWVRETWAIEDCGRRVSLAKEAWPEGWPLKRLRYPSTDKAPYFDRKQDPYWWNTRPSIHMPRWASRLTLEITGVRVERLQAISEADARAEGIIGGLSESGTSGWGNNEGMPDVYKAKWGFKALWDSINGGNLNHGGGPHAWVQNPWVWVVEFKGVKP